MISHSLSLSLEVLILYRVGKKSVGVQHVQREQYRCLNVELVWSKLFEFSNFDDGILEVRTRRYSMLSAKQQLSNIKHGGGIRPNVRVLTFGPPCSYTLLLSAGI